MKANEYTNLNPVYNVGKKQQTNRFVLNHAPLLIITNLNLNAKQLTNMYVKHVELLQIIKNGVHILVDPKLVMNIIEQE